MDRMSLVTPMILSAGSQGGFEMVHKSRIHLFLFCHVVFRCFTFDNLGDNMKWIWIMSVRFSYNSRFSLGSFLRAWRIQ